MKRITSISIAIIIMFSMFNFVILANETNVENINFSTENLWEKQAQTSAQYINNSVINLKSGSTMTYNGWNMLLGKKMVTNYEASFKMKITPDRFGDMGNGSSLKFTLKNNQSMNSYYYLDFKEASFNLIYVNTIVKYSSTGNLRLADGYYHDYKVQVFDNESSGLTIKVWVDAGLLLDYSSNGNENLKDYLGNDIGEKENVTGEGNIILQAQNTDISIVSTPNYNEITPNYYFVDANKWFTDKTDSSKPSISNGSIIIPNGLTENSYVNCLSGNDNTLRDFTSDFNFKILKSENDVDPNGYRMGIALRYQTEDITEPFSNNFSENGYYLMFRDDKISLNRGNTTLGNSNIVNIANNIEHNIKLSIFNVPNGVQTFVWIDSNLVLSYLDDSSKKIYSAGYMQVVSQCAEILLKGENNAVNPLKVLFIGNEITTSKPIPELGWDGTWGMAASSEDKDYVNIVMQYVKQTNPDAKYLTFDASGFEKSYTYISYNMDLFSAARDFDADIIVMRIGENCREQELKTTPFNVQYLRVIDYLNKSGNAKIIITTSFNDYDILDDEISIAARSRNYPLVKLGDLSKDESNLADNKYKGTKLAAYPGDIGMKKIADRIIESLSSILNGGDGLTSLFLKDLATGVSVEISTDVTLNNTTLKVERINSNIQYEQIKQSLNKFGILEIYDISLQNKPEPMGTIEIVFPRPKYTKYKSLYIYFKGNDGTLEKVTDVKFGNSSIKAKYNKLGVFIIVEELYPYDVLSDGIIDGKEITSIIKNSPDGLVRISIDKMERFILHSSAFSTILYTGYPIELVFVEGVMNIPYEVFAAITISNESLEFFLSSMNSLDIDMFNQTLESKKITPYNVYYYVGIMKNGENISISLPIDIKINKSILRPDNKLSVICMEEDMTLSAENCTVNNNYIQFKAKNFGFYTLSNAVDLNMLNPNTGDNIIIFDNIFILIGIFAFCFLGIRKLKKIKDREKNPEVL